MGEFYIKAFQYAFSMAFASPQPSAEEMTEKMNDIFNECAGKDDLAMVTNEVDIKVIKVDKKWKIEVTDEVSNAILGDLKTAAEEANNSLNISE